ncbi:MAG: hypothetical protein K2Q22_16860, partial [Cytophagales bacterium]|nr:hypothetical protein [Cytophagales bacterium]
MNTNSVSGNVGLELRSYAGGGALQYIDFSSNSTNQATPDFVNRISSSANGLNLQTQSATGLFLQNSNAFIGIGTSSPVATLDVNGSARISGNLTITSFAGAGTQALGVNNLGQLVTITGGTGTSQWVSTTGGSIFYNQGGYVGINSAIPPIAHLDVNGISVFRTTFCAWCDGVNVIGTPTGSKGFIIHEGPANATSVNQTTGRYFLCMIGSYQTFSFIVNGLTTSILTQPNAMAQLSTINGGTFNVNGRIGIATPSPVATLDVNGSARIAGNLTITSFAGAGTQALGVNNLGQLVTVSGGTSTTQWVADITYVTVPGIKYTGGQVSTNKLQPTTPNIYSPSAMDDMNSQLVLGRSGITENTDGDFYLRAFWGINLDRRGGNGNGPGNTNYGQNGTFGVRYRTSPTTFRTDLLIDDLGRVGIGTTSPIATLDVNGNSRFIGTITISSFAGGGTQALGVNNLGQLVTVSGGTSTSQWVTTTSGIYSPVNAAIGTAPDPTFNFKVAGNQSGPTPAQLVLQGSTDPNQQLMMGYNTQSSVAGGEWGSIQAIKQFSGPVPLVLQNYGGNVGIGTNNPLAKLTVNGNASISGITTVGGLNVRNLIGPGTVTVDGFGNLGLGAFTATSSSQWVNSAATTPGIYYTGGKVGIGLADPTHFSNVPFIVRGATAPQAIFGDNQSGVAITAGNPGIWFNSYFFSGGLRNMIGGYASSIGQNPSSGIFSLYITTATGTANTINPSI